MTRTHRILAIALAGAVLLSSFALGRWTNGPQASAETSSALPTATGAAVSGPARSGNAERKTYLQDYKAGYDAGYNTALTGQMAQVPETDQAAYNEGFKQGYANAHQLSTVAVPAAPSNTVRTVRYVAVPARAKRRNSKLRTVLTIAGPAAVGAGIGALAGGGKGAGVGALLGGGGGAIYHLIKRR